MPLRGPLCANVTSSIKPEVHNVSQRRQGRTEPRPWVTRAITAVKIGRVVLEICSQTDRQTHTHKYLTLTVTYILLALISNPSQRTAVRDGDFLRDRRQGRGRGQMSAAVSSDMGTNAVNHIHRPSARLTDSARLMSRLNILRPPWRRQGNRLSGLRVDRTIVHRAYKLSLNR